MVPNTKEKNVKLAKFAFFNKPALERLSYITKIVG